MSDPKVYVKEGCISAFKEILQIIGPVRFFLALKHTPRAETVVIREEVILLHLMVTVIVILFSNCCSRFYCLLRVLTNWIILS